MFGTSCGGSMHQSNGRTDRIDTCLFCSELLQLAPRMERIPWRWRCWTTFSARLLASPCFARKEWPPFFGPGYVKADRLRLFVFFHCWSLRCLCQRHGCRGARSDSATACPCHVRAGDGGARWTWTAPPKTKSGKQRRHTDDTTPMCSGVFAASLWQLVESA